MVELSVNLDHIATLRNVRHEGFPSILQAAKTVLMAGANGVTLHLREDRRHIRDKDIKDFKKWNKLPLNFEMANTREMLEIAIETNPKAICLVPEKRHELTTEGGLDVYGQEKQLFNLISNLHSETESKISLFVEPNIENVYQALKVKADCIEIHTGKLLVLAGKELNDLYSTIRKIASVAVKEGLVCHAGHGINYYHAKQLSMIKSISALNIGHFIISESIFVGLENSIKKMKYAISEGEKNQQ